jgi:hypothetical protein
VKFSHKSLQVMPSNLLPVHVVNSWPPGPDIAIFYRHDGERIPDPGIIVIGKVGADVVAFDVPGPAKVRMELVD